MICHRRRGCTCSVSEELRDEPAWLALGGDALELHEIFVLLGGAALGQLTDLDLRHASYVQDGLHVELL